MTMNQLIYFCAVAEEEHYGQAARRLYISQPSLSRAMAALEAELGVVFFRRVGRNVALTEAGRRFYEKVKPALSQLEAARAAVEPYSEKRRAPVIGCVSPAVTAVLTPLLDAYRAAGHDDPWPEVRVGISEALVEALRQGRCDLALCTRVHGAQGVRFHTVARLPFVVVMREDHPLAHSPIVRPEQLSGQPMTFTSAPAYNDMIRRMLAHYHVVPVVHSSANDDAAMFGAVRAGSAIFITSDYPQLYSPGLAIRPLRQDFCLREICLASTERSGCGPAAGLLRFIAEGRWAEGTEDAGV